MHAIIYVEGEGIGPGLSICKGGVEAQSGEITVGSVMGKGTKSIVSNLTLIDIRFQEMKTRTASKNS